MALVDGKKSEFDKLKRSPVDEYLSLMEYKFRKKEGSGS